MTTDIDHSLFADYVSGATLAELAERHSICESTVWRTIQRVGAAGDWAELSRVNREADTWELVAQVASHAGRAFDLRPGLIWAETRTRVVVRARQATFLVSSERGASLKSIGRAFEMDHTTILYGCRQAAALSLEVADFGQRIAQLRTDLDLGMPAERLAA